MYKLNRILIELQLIAPAKQTLQYGFHFGQKIGDNRQYFYCILPPIASSGRTDWRMDTFSISKINNIDYKSRVARPEFPDVSRQDQKQYFGVSSVAKGSGYLLPLTISWKNFLFKRLNPDIIKLNFHQKHLISTKC